MPKTHLVGVWDAGTGLTTVARPRGQFFRTVGKAAGGGVRLLPEEALYLVERGSLDLRWGGGEGEGEGEGEEWSLSLQAAYALLCGALGLSLERFTVYAGLKRCGYIVQRAPSWDRVGECDAGSFAAETRVEHGTGVFTWLYRLLRGGWGVHARPRGPLVAPGLYRSYSSCSIFGIMMNRGSLILFLSPFSKSKRRHLPPPLTDPLA